MISSLDASSQAFLAALTRSQQRVARAQSEISSGRRVQTASDAPDQIDRLLQLHSAVEHNRQIQTNLSRAKTQTDTAEQVLSEAAKLMDRALVLAGQGAGSTQSAEARASLAKEIEGIQQQMVAYTGTAVSGRLIFSGDQDQATAYELDPTSVTGVNRLFTMSATAQLEDPAGGSFPIAQTAEEIFDHRNEDDSPASDNVFASLSSLRTALLNNDTAGISDSIVAVQTASTHLNSALSFYGTLQTRIADATSFAGKYDTRLRTELSGIEDADAVAAALEMTQGNSQIQAALSARAKMPRTTLFDLLG